MKAGDHLALMAALLLAPAGAADPPKDAKPTELLPGFRRGPWFGEQVRERWVEGSVRVLVSAPGRFDPKRPTLLVVYATPNGNTIEQTLGCDKADGLDWHFDIQHVAAQVRRLRELAPADNVVLACVEAEGLSWPAWRRTNADAPARIRRVVEGLRELVPGKSPRVTLTGHSGGGSFIFGFIEAADSLPDYVDRIAFLDANYSFDAEKHGDRLLGWLRGAAERRLTVIAYDDRSIMLDGKPVVAKDGGTFRASRRMVDRFGKVVALNDGQSGPFVTHTGFDGRLSLYIHPNPENRILHTALVGEINGLLKVLIDGSPKSADWGTFGGPRAYTRWVQPAPGIPPRPVGAPGGSEFVKRLAGLSAAVREEAMATEILRGNVPDSLRKFRSVTVRAKDKGGKEHTATFEVMPDYLAVGADTDFVRLPVTPMTAQRIADAFGCALPTRKVVDDVYRSASAKLEPIPLSEDRESLATFVRHHELIERQRTGWELGALVAGIKKDVVVTNRLGEKPKRVALYGWHRLDGTPIQPLTVVHRDTYVDYSHGVRLMKRTVAVDGKPRDVRDVLHVADVCGLLSDEGPIGFPTYERD